ncbi:MAG: ATP-binding protein [Acidimicrobiales bacterium]
METMPVSRWQLPRLDRNERWVGGVAAAIARELGVQPMVIRVSFVVLATVGGWGLVLYALGWAVLAIGTPDHISPYRPQPKAATSAHRHLGVAMVVLGMVLGLLPLTNDAFDGLVWPVGFVLTGALIAWSRSQDQRGGLSAIARVFAGLSVAVGGMLAFAALQFDLVDTIIALVFGIAILAGMVLVAAPSVVRMARDLDGERLERTRADERARISAHLHDSVLQSLSLIQRNVEDPHLTARIARQQERELRTWLYGRPPTTPDGVRLESALHTAADRVESQHGVLIEVVAVGDADDLAAADVSELLAAATEAMTNAARHSGVDRIDVYAERHNGTIDVFVRDTGVGFDPHTIDSDRKGVAESIVARMDRAGGSATISSAPGAGTEVELSMPLPGPSASEGEHR